MIVNRTSTPVMMFPCPKCHQPNPRGTIACRHCRVDFYDALMDQVTTHRLRPMPDGAMFKDQYPSHNPVICYLRAAEEPVALPRQKRILIGRQDEMSPDIQPDFDLQAYNAAEQGVSRRHAVMQTNTNLVFITDVGSANGTFINGQRLTPDQPYTLKSGDELRLGHLVMQIYYRKPT